MPVEYSEVSTSVPRTRITSCPNSATPVTLACVASKPTLACAAMCGQVCAVPRQSATVQAKPARTSRIRDQ